MTANFGELILVSMIPLRVQGTFRIIFYKFLPISPIATFAVLFAAAGSPAPKAFPTRTPAAMLIPRGIYTCKTTGLNDYTIYLICGKVYWQRHVS